MRGVRGLGECELEVQVTNLAHLVLEDNRDEGVEHEVSRAIAFTRRLWHPRGAAFRLFTDSGEPQGSVRSRCRDYV